MTFAGGIAVGVFQAVSPLRLGHHLPPATPFVLSIIALLWLSRHRVVSISRAAH
jgi:hypothetical protein